MNNSWEARSGEYVNFDYVCKLRCKWVCNGCTAVVTATDLDSVTNSQLTYSVSDHSFSVQTLNNIGYIKTARSVYLLRYSLPCCDLVVVNRDIIYSAVYMEVINKITESQPLMSAIQRSGLDVSVSHSESNGSCVIYIRLFYPTDPTVLTLDWPPILSTPYLSIPYLDPTGSVRDAYQYF